MTNELIERPEDQLDLLKSDTKSKISKTKLTLAAAKRKLTEIDKLNGALVPNKAELYAAKLEEIAKLEQEKDDLVNDWNILNGTAEDDLKQRQIEAIDRVKKEWLVNNPSAGYLTDDDRFVYIDDVSTSDDQQNVQYRQVLPRSFGFELAGKLGVNIEYIPPGKLINLFNNEKRFFRTARYSTNPAVWNSDYYLPIKHMEPYFITELSCKYDGSEYSEYFDVLMQSLCGGSPENIDHLEKWILHKVINWRKAASTPDLVIVGSTGGNGKGILHEIMQRIFPSTLVGKANGKTLSGDFNSILMGKIVVTFDDQKAKSIPFDVVKQLSGAGTMIFEPKGKDQFEGEKTHTSLWLSNNLLWKLNPGGKEGGIDRRFSVMRSNYTFIEKVQEHHGNTISVDEAKTIIESVVENIFKSRHEIAKWFAALQKRHPEVDREYTLKALHGADYQYFVDASASAFDIVWRKLVLPTLKAGGCVPIRFISAFVSQRDGFDMSEKSAIQKLKDAAAQEKIVIETARIKTTITPAIGNASKRWLCVRVVGTTPTQIDWSTISTTKYDGSDNVSDGDWAFDDTDVSETDDENVDDTVDTQEHLTELQRAVLRRKIARENNQSSQINFDK